MGITVAKRVVRVGMGLLLVLSAPRPARAAGSANPAVAEALYEEGRGLMKKGKFDQACPKLKQSYELDPGGGTLLNLAECYERQGKFASAWSAFKEAQVVAQRDGRAERVDYAKKHIEAIEAKISKVTIEVPNDSNTPGLSVTLDGAELGSAAWNVAVPIDPGAHELNASAPGKQSYEQHFEIAAPSLSTTLTVPKLQDNAVAAPSVQPVAQGATEKIGPREPAAERGGRTPGYILLGAGVVGVGVGSYFGLHAMSKWNERNDQCVGGCTVGAKSAGDSASSAALIADIGFGVGLVAAGVGTYLILSSQPSGQTNAEGRAPGDLRHSLQVLPAIAANGGGVCLRGAY